MSSLVRLQIDLRVLTKRGLAAAKVKAKPVFDTLGRGEMLADARPGRIRCDTLVGLGVADGNQSLTAPFTRHNLFPPLVGASARYVEVGSHR
jgi:hypothetical protein